MVKTSCLLLAALWLGALSLRAQTPALAPAPVKVLVYPGTELLQVIHLLSDTAQVATSTYNAEVLRYFGAYRRHPAVRRARQLRRISCDMPVRLSWAFYNFPDLKVATMQARYLDGYETEFDLRQMQIYFQECARFYYDTRFWTFFQAHAPLYAGWVAGFERGLYQDGQLATVEQFYRLPRERPVVITLGPLNCGSYAMSDLRGLNPNLPNQRTIMVAYGQVAGGGALPGAAPTFYAPARTSQIVFHELGHAYLGPLFGRYRAQVQRLAPLFMRQDSALSRAARQRGGWSSYLEENVTQAVTNLLRARAGYLSRAEARQPDEFYRLAAELRLLIEQGYDGSPRYADFGRFFPVLLARLEQRHARRTTPVSRGSGRRR